MRASDASVGGRRSKVAAVIEILSPEALRAELRQRARAIAALYGSPLVRPDRENP